MSGLEILEAIRRRRSIRRYRPVKVPKRVVETILDAARWAPSAHNAQPWRFIVISDPEVKRRVAEAMAAEWIRDMAKDGVMPERRLSLASSSIKRLSGTPLIIVVCLSMEGMHSYPDERRRKFEYLMAVQSLSAAIQNMLLAIHSMGLGACWLSAPLFSQEAVRRVLHIPEEVEPQALLTVGYPAEDPKPPPRKPLIEIAYRDYWGLKL